MPADLALARAFDDEGGGRAANDDRAGAAAGAREPTPAASTADRGRRTGPWHEPDFDPRYKPGSFFHAGGKTYKVHDNGRTQLVADLIVEPVGEIVTILDVDHPELRERRLRVRFTLRGRAPLVVLLDPCDASGSISSSLVRAVPDTLARASVVNRADLVGAMVAFRPVTFGTVVHVQQTGWLPDGSFALPGAEHVDLARTAALPGSSLWRLTPTPSLDTARVGAAALLKICQAAPCEVVAPLLGTMFAAPIYRRPDHLGARGFACVATGASQSGKTTLVSRCGSLLGAFYKQPQCVMTWASTATTIAQALHAYRDLPIPIDDYREIDRDSREVFRQVVLAIGDGASRGRSEVGRAGMKVAPAFRPLGLPVITGEQSVDDDAAIAGRVVDVGAHDIDVERLLAIDEGRLDAMPHLYSAFLRFVAGRPAEYWADARAQMREIALSLGCTESRSGENLATIAVALGVSVSFFETAFGKSSELATRYRAFVQQYGAILPEVARQQAQRVRDEAIDAIALNELARGLRQGLVALVNLAQRGAAPSAKLVGAFDEKYLYLEADVVTHWVNRELLRTRRRGVALGRKTLGWALAARAKLGNKFRVQRTFAGRVRWVWCIPRACLGDAWLGLLDGPEGDHGVGAGE